MVETARTSILARAAISPVAEACHRSRIATITRRSLFGSASSCPRKYSVRSSTSATSSSNKGRPGSCLEPAAAIASRRGFAPVRISRGRTPRPDASSPATESHNRRHSSAARGSSFTRVNIAKKFRGSSPAVSTPPAAVASSMIAGSDSSTSWSCSRNSAPAFAQVCSRFSTINTRRLPMRSAVSTTLART